MDLRTYQQQAIVTNKWLTERISLVQLLAEKRIAKVWVTAEEAHLFACDKDHMHMVMGMTSEIKELDLAIYSKDRVGVEEELGDIMWYAANEASMQRIQIQAQLDVGYYTFKHLVNAVSDYTDLIRKTTVHEKEIAKEELAKQLQHLVEVCYNFDFSSNFAKIDLPKALKNNIDKLHKVRYKLGYSLEAFNNRDLEAERKELEKDDTTNGLFDLPADNVGDKLNGSEKGS